MQLSTVFPVGLFGADGPLQSELDGQLKHGSASSRYHDLRGISLVPAFRVRAKPIRRRPMAVANVPW